MAKVFRLLLQTVKAALQPYRVEILDLESDRQITHKAWTQVYDVRPDMEFWEEWSKATLEEKETIYSNMVYALDSKEDEYDYED
ncbi:MAG: hypothetical protein EBR82_69890 [Caulobacteraceae bacterium]|nr:hypothetical protein [Caulobacteraceae bacterium]